MLAQLKRSSFNDAHVLTSAAANSEGGDAAAVNLELVRADLALLRHAHEQRCLLLRCVHQLLAIAYDVEAELHAVACGELSLLLQVVLCPCHRATLIVDELAWPG